MYYKYHIYIYIWILLKIRGPAGEVSFGGMIRGTHEASEFPAFMGWMTVTCTRKIGGINQK